MNIIRNIKKILHVYHDIQSPSKKIIAYGSWISYELALIAVGLFLLHVFNPSSYYLESIYLFAKTSLTVFLELILSALIFDIVFHN